MVQERIRLALQRHYGIEVKGNEKMKADYMKTIGTTDEEKLEMYMKQSKKSLAQMLISANKAIDKRGLRVENIEMSGLEISALAEKSLTNHFVWKGWAVSR